MEFIQIMWLIITAIMVLTIILSFVADIKNIRDAAGWGVFAAIFSTGWFIYTLIVTDVVT